MAKHDDTTAGYPVLPAVMTAAQAVMDEPYASRFYAVRPVMAFKAREVRASYGGIVYRVCLSATGMPLLVDHYSGRGRKRGELHFTGGDCKGGFSLPGIDRARFAEDPYPTGGDRFLDGSRAVMAAFWAAGGDEYAALGTLGKVSGHCAICGACLTVPESMARGIGPECIKKPGVQAWWLKQLAVAQDSPTDAAALLAALKSEPIVRGPNVCIGAVPWGRRRGYIAPWLEIALFLLACFALFCLATSRPQASELAPGGVLLPGMQCKVNRAEDAGSRAGIDCCWAAAKLAGGR